MTTPGSSTVVERFQLSTAFRPVVVATIAIAVVAGATSPPGWVSVGVVIAVVAALGIPHGAVDHLVVEAIDGRTATSRRRFVCDYALAMVGVGLVWLVAPPLALAGFLVASVHHFGQSDLAYLRLRTPTQLTVQWSRGLLLVGLPLVAHLPEVAPIIERLGDVDTAEWGWLADRWWVWSALLIGQHVVVGSLAAPDVHPRDVVREVVTVAALAALFLAADPLIGFAVYFGLWHSLAHLLVLADLLGTDPNPVRSVVRLAAPLTVVSLGGLGLAVATAALAGSSDLLVPLVFVGVSMLTMPHMVVVERLWRRPARDRVSSPATVATR